MRMVGPLLLRDAGQDIGAVGEQGGSTLLCLPHKPCKVAFASHNPITLKCGERPKHASIYWQYLDLSDSDAQPVTLDQSKGRVSQDQPKILELIERSRLIFGDLKILSPRVVDTGVYTCKDKERYLAYYEIDFQDAEGIYISHRSLGQSVQTNTTFQLPGKGTVDLFTVWSGWQACDRCGKPGERKKVGFCYSKVLDEVSPCGLHRAKFKDIPSNHRAELRIEMCRMACAKATPTIDEASPLLIDNYHTHLHADAFLICPTSSIYQPVYWEHGNVSVTRLQQLRRRSPYILDNATGGGSLFIPILNQSDQGFYRCYVDQGLAGHYHVRFPDLQFTGQRPYSPVESMIIGLAVFLIFLILLSIAHACRRATGGVVH
ncbi:protein FAM187B [Pelodytes ibericus]